MIDHLIGRIYEAAGDPRLWEGVLHEIAQHCDAAGAMTMVATLDSVNWIASSEIKESVEAFFSEGWHLKDRRTEMLLGEQYPGFRLETDFHTPRALAAMPVHKHFLRPRGLHVGAGTVFPGLRDDVLIVTVEGFRSHAAAAKARIVLDALRPHIGRALSLSARLNSVRSSALVEALSIVGVAAAIIDSRGKLSAANALFETLFHSRLAVSAHHGIATFADSGLQLAVESVRLRGMQGRSVPLDAMVGGYPAAAHVLPLAGITRDFAGSDGALIAIASAGNATLPATDLLRLMFDLTPAEARLARALLIGGTLAAAAQSIGVTVGTARKQLASIFSKVGVAKQAELARILSGLGL